MNYIEKIGIWEVLSFSDHRTKDGGRYANVRCSVCGFEATQQYRHLKETKECRHIMKNGLYINQNNPIKNKKIRDTYDGMLQRCYNKKSKDYRFYGGKGVTICEEWFLDRKKFEEWSLANGYADDLSIDRIDPKKGYSPENCRWISFSKNCREKTTTNYIEVDGEIHSGKEWSKIINKGINFVNRKIRQIGKEKTIDIIKEELKKQRN